MKQITQYLLLQYIVVCLGLIILYRGGNLFAPETTHYIIDQNYLSDLGRTHFFSGNNNPYWFIYTITLSFVGIGTFLFFNLTSKTIVTKYNKAILFFALISALGYIGIAIFPVDIKFEHHIISGQIAYFSFFFSSILLNFLMDKKTYPDIFKYLLLLNIFLLGFLLLSVFGPHSSEGTWALSLKTMAQKIMIVVQISISLLILQKIKTVK